MNDRDEQLLEGFFSRRLTPAENSELDARRADNKSLEEDIRLGQSIRQTYISQESDRLKSLLESEEKALKNRGGMRVLTRRLIALAAVLIPLILFVWPHDTPESLFADAFVPYDNRLAAQGAADDYELKVQKASNLYNQKQYAQAAAAFDELARIKPNQPAFPFYRGIALLGDGQNEAALTELQKVNQMAVAPYHIEAQWYIGLAHMRLGHKNEAKSAIQNYINLPGSKYVEKARQLLDKL